MGQYADDIAFERIDPDESRICVNGDYAGDVYGFGNADGPEPRVWRFHLNEDRRGWHRVSRRSDILDTVGWAVATRPLW